MKTKRIFAILLAVVCMLTCLPCTAFAAENSSENPVVTSHTITIEIPAGKSCESEVMPCIWGQKMPSVPKGSSVNTSSFYVSDPYFGYDVTGNLTNGQHVDEEFYVKLKCGDYDLAGLVCKANGNTFKRDWISIPSTNYYFQIINQSTFDLSVTITYYSWK